MCRAVAVSGNGAFLADTSEIKQLGLLAVCKLGRAARLSEPSGLQLQSWRNLLRNPVSEEDRNPRL
jgi:hypothetical protein